MSRSLLSLLLLLSVVACNEEPAPPDQTVRPESPAPEASRSFADLLGDAKVAYAAEDYEKAHQRFEQAAVAGLAEVLEKMGEPETALAYRRRVARKARRRSLEGDRAS